LIAARVYLRLHSLWPDVIAHFATDLLIFS